MGDNIKFDGNLCYRTKESWFKELLIKLHIIKPKYKSLGKGILEIQEDKENENSLILTFKEV